MTRTVTYSLVLLSLATCAIAKGDIPSVQEHYQIGNRSFSKAELEIILEEIVLSNNFTLKNEIKPFWSQEETPEPKKPLMCEVCEVFTRLIQILHMLSGGDVGPVNGALIAPVAKFFCTFMRLAPRPYVCKKMVESYRVPVMKLITQGDENYKQICGVIIKNCKESALDDWRVDVPPNKPEVANRQILSATDRATKIIQFTDLHMDLDYTVGANTNCGNDMPTCCRDNTECTSNEAGAECENPYGVFEKAGEWGDFRCALRYNTLEKMFEHARDEHQEARYIFLTGDYTHSRVWLYSRTENERHIANVTETLAKIFSERNVIIYPVVGNHEPDIVNMYPPQNLWSTGEFSLTWMYEAAMKPFEKYFNSADIETFYKYGYYTHKPEESLRIIVLNTNICSPENFWLGYVDKTVEPPEPEAFTQLKWLENTLRDSEKQNENVLIVGHIEPGSCYPHWSEEYNRIVERYEGIIRGSFYGHSHKPHYRVAMANHTTRPILASFISGSGVPDHMNPSYSVFYVDGERVDQSQWDVLRQELYIVNLLKSNSEDNKEDKPVIEKLTDSYVDFGLPNLTPASIVDFADKMVCDQELIDRYSKFHTKGSDSPAYSKCPTYSFSCRRDLLCGIFSSNSADDTACKHVEAVIRARSCPKDTSGQGGDSGSEQTRRVNLSSVFVALIMSIVRFIQ